MIQLPSTRLAATPVLSHAAHEIQTRYERLDPAEQWRLLLALAREHTAHLDAHTLLKVLCDLADVITPFGNAPFGDPPHAYQPPQTEVAGPVYLTLKLGNPKAEKPFTMSVFRNPLRYQTGSPVQPQLLITSFPIDFAGAVSTYHRWGDEIERFLERLGYRPAPEKAADG